jgi:hypothetical protein
MTTEEIRLSALGTIELTKQTELNTIYQKIKEASENGFKSIEMDDINLSNITALEVDKFTVSNTFTLLRVNRFNKLAWFTCYYKIEWDF